MMNEYAAPDWSVGQCHRYSAYGLAIHSDIQLPELNFSQLELSGQSVLRITRGSVQLPSDLAKGTDIRFAPDGVCLHWDTVGAFHVSPSGNIVADPAPDVGDDLLAFPLLGPVLALALHMRGLFLLHASAVALKSGPSVVLMGDKGAGKSTTATALLEAGHSLLADDLVTFNQQGAAQVLPGFAQVKLSDAALTRLKLPGTTVRPSVHDAIDKHRVLVQESFADRAAPLSRLYVLDRDQTARAPRAETYPVEAALPQFLRFGYPPRFGRAALEGAMGAQYFRQAVLLVQTGLLRRLVLPAGLDRLPELVAFIEDDAGAST